MSDPYDMLGKMFGGLGDQSHEAQSELRRRKIIELEADLADAAHGANAKGDQ